LARIADRTHLSVISETDFPFASTERRFQMTVRSSAALLPALLFALGVALFQAPAQASETAMNTGAGHQQFDAPFDDDSERGGD
jgi:hypothetical protein